MNSPAFCLLALLALLLLGTPTPVRADLIVHEECGVEFWVPETWEHRLQDDLLILHSPDEKVQLFFLTSGLQVPDQNSDAFRADIARVVTHAEVVSAGRQKEINELLCYAAHGFGVFEEEIVDWELRFIAGARKSLMIIALGDLDLYREEIEQIYKTIQLTKSEPEEAQEQ